MTSEASRWGRRAAREGVPYSANPYRNIADRRAWSAAHNEERAQLAQLKENKQ